jgi:uncharacterized protein (DUF4415 family)
MKSDATPKKFPATGAEWEAVIAAAPGDDRPWTAADQAALGAAHVVNGGGYAAVRESWAQKRLLGQRRSLHHPVKKSVSVRYSPEVLAFFKATGSGWQTRMNEALLDWVHQRSA